MKKKGQKNEHQNTKNGEEKKRKKWVDFGCVASFYSS